MTDALDDLPLAAEFPAATQQQWRKLVDGVLKGAPFEKRLVSAGPMTAWPSAALCPRRPARSRSPAAARASPGRSCSAIDHPDPAAANALALHDLENGATGLTLVFAGSVGAYGYGLDASAATIDRALADVHLDAGIAIDLDLSPHDQGCRRKSSPNW